MSKLRKFSVEGWEMELGNHLVEFFWKFINFTFFVFSSLSVLPKLNLGENLVSE
jgi:hypothetical protein